MKKWIALLPLLPVTVSLCAVLTVSVDFWCFGDGSAFLGMIVSVIGPLWLLQNLIVCPVGMPVLQGVFSKLRLWQIPVFVLANMLGSVTYFCLYTLITGQTDPEGQLLAFCEPIATGVITLIACIAVWIICHIRDKKQEQ